ncbi:ATP-binding protein [Pannonibacter sp. Pt2]|uniref:histidine kinase n=1 Tax=Pannonibacter anstelovis TaxID=3121537 RepID=A0ABU7ZNV0_9HYPH
MKRSYQRRRPARQKLLILAGLVLLSVIIVWLTGVASLRITLADLQTRKAAILSVQSTALEQLLDKFRLMTPLLARRPDIAAIVAGDEKEEGSRIAAIAGGMSSAQAVWFLTPDGATVAASTAMTRSGVQEVSPIGPAFSEAMAGQLGRQLLPGSPGQASSYVFTSAIREDSRVVGAVAVRVSLEDVEQAWALSRDPLIAVDGRGRIVASNVPGWRGLAFDGRHDMSGASLLLDLYPSVWSKSLQFVHSPDGQGGRPFLALQETLPVLGWTVHILSDTGEAERQTANAMLTAFLLTIIGSGLFWSLLERQDAMVRRMRSDRAMAHWLERRVRSRTKDLLTANLKLEQEVRERMTAEEELRRTQADLVQAAKLATLGQMSAALSHEFNQPLATIRTYAENADRLIDRGQEGRAKENLGRITAMVERMAEISRTLKGFTRRSGSDLQAIPIRQVLDEVMLLLMPQVKRRGVAILSELPGAEIAVMGGRIRLEQVIMNLISNALDAVKDVPAPQVEVKVAVENDVMVLTVSDNGPGIPAAVMEQIFDPFFTTKGVGEGLGLGLSIAYKIVHDFAGTLTASNREEGGACFTIRLPLAGAQAVAAG